MRSLTSHFHPNSRSFPLWQGENHRILIFAWNAENRAKAELKVRERVKSKERMDATGGVDPSTVSTPPRGFHAVPVSRLFPVPQARPLQQLPPRHDEYQRRDMGFDRRDEDPYQRRGGGPDNFGRVEDRLGRSDDRAYDRRDDGCVIVDPPAQKIN
jgi:hypothetical protein